jgi:hypothetical protein
MKMEIHVASRISLTHSHSYTTELRSGQSVVGNTGESGGGG